MFPGSNLMNDGYGYDQDQQSHGHLNVQDIIDQLGDMKVGKDMDELVFKYVLENNHTFKEVADSTFSAQKIVGKGNKRPYRILNLAMHYAGCSAAQKSAINQWVDYAADMKEQNPKIRPEYLPPIEEGVLGGRQFMFEYVGLLNTNRFRYDIELCEAWIRENYPNSNLYGDTKYNNGNESTQRSYFDDYRSAYDRKKPSPGKKLYRETQKALPGIKLKKRIDLTQKEVHANLIRTDSSSYSPDYQDYQEKRKTKSLGFSETNGDIKMNDMKLKEKQAYPRKIEPSQLSEKGSYLGENLSITDKNVNTTNTSYQSVDNWARDQQHNALQNKYFGSFSNQEMDFQYPDLQSLTQHPIHYQKTQKKQYLLTRSKNQESKSDKPTLIHESSYSTQEKSSSPFIDTVKIESSKPKFVAESRYIGNDYKSAEYLAYSDAYYQNKFKRIDGSGF